MRAVLPGKPEAKLQALSTASWGGKRLVVYISGNGVVILGGPQDLIQTIHLDHCDELQAAAIDKRSGNIAIAAGDEVFVYKPFGGGEAALKWSLSVSLRLSDGSRGDISLSWGSEEELLTGRTHLSIWQTKSNGHRIWDQLLAKPVKIALFSPSADMIASTGCQDRLIKLWRRQSFEEDDTHFEFSYLPHPRSVTAIRWRNPPAQNTRQHDKLTDDVLYSTCADGKIRIWAAMDSHDGSQMRVWAQIDMSECLQPRYPDGRSCSADRFVVFLDRVDFLEAMASLSSSETGDHNVERQLGHLLEVVDLQPDVCIVFDRHGTMSAWGLKNVGCENGTDDKLFNILHVQDVHLAIDQGSEISCWNNLGMTCFAFRENTFAILIHHFDGRIVWHSAKGEDFFAPSPPNQRLLPFASWTGHREPIVRLTRDVTGRALISFAEKGEALLWKREDRAGMHLMSHRCSFTWGTPVIHCCILPGGDFVITVHSNEIILWDTSTAVAQMVNCCPLKLTGEVVCLASRRVTGMGAATCYVVAVNASLNGFIYKIRLPGGGEHDMAITNNKASSMDEFATFGVTIREELDRIMLIDSAGSETQFIGPLDNSVQMALMGWSATGTVYLFDVSIEPEASRVRCHATSVARTGLSKPSLALASCSHKLAMVDSTGLRLTIWDTKSSQLEHDETYEGPITINDLDWSYTSDAQSLLALGFPYQVTILAQMRYQFGVDSQAWAPIRRIDTKAFSSHPIGDSVWLDCGNVAIGAGNQLYIFGQEIDGADDMISSLQLPIHTKGRIGMLDLVSYLNGPLPVFHPQFLGQCLLAGKSRLAHRIALELNNALKYFAPGDDLDTYLAIPLTEIYASKPINIGSGSRIDSNDEVNSDYMDEDIAVSLGEQLAKLELPHLTGEEQLRLVEAVQCLAVTHRQSEAIDVNGLRYYFMFSESMLNRRQSKHTIQISWREIVWAAHSMSQDILVDRIARQYRGRPLWTQAKHSGMFLWLTDRSALEMQFENVARNEYTKTEEKDPVHCSLYYLALKKKNVLIGLWRMATWNREQAGTIRMLKNDFSQSRWRTAASKNAYALLGKRRFEYAAAWFILAEKLRDAVNICANQMGDIQLAIAVARVHGGDDGPVLRTLLEETVLRHACYDGNHWQAAWAFHMLGKPDMAVKALTEPLQDLIHCPSSPPLEARSYLSHDPTLLIHYRELRDKLTKDPKFYWPISPRAEWDFVMNTARTYDRMGCDVLALELVRNWQFIRSDPRTPVTIPEVKKARRKSTRRRSSTKVPATQRSPVEERPRPTMIEEPDANSLLDNFGF